MTDTWQRDIDMQLQQFQPNNHQNNGQQRRATFEADPRHWQEIFNKYDTDHDGVISLAEMRYMLQSVNYAHDLPDDAVAKIIDLSDHNQDGTLHLNEFLHLVHSGALPSGVFSRVLQKYVHTLVAPRSGRMWHDVVDGEYEEQYSCYPPPIAMLIVALIEMGFFLYDVISTGDVYSIHGPLSEALVYNPHKRHEAWRFITYMLVHVGHMHLMVNMFVLLMLGIPLEMVHHWWRVLIIYLAGVLAGSLGTSVTDPAVYLAGASGGVYAILSAHLATIILNWSEMSFPIVQLLVFMLLMVVDVGTAIYQRYVVKVDTQIGYVAHFAGAVAGLLVGIKILRNLNRKSWERKLWWAALALFIILLSTCIIWNIAFMDYFPEPYYSMS